MKSKKALFAVLTLSLTASPLWAELQVNKSMDSVLDPQALTIKGEYGPVINGNSFQQDAVITQGKYQYVGYYDANRRVCIARRKLPVGNWEIIRFQDYEFKSNDSHNTISLGICPKDGTLHLAFDHHVSPLHYRVSQKGAATNPEAIKWDASLFGPVISELEKGKPIRITYPRFLQTPDGGLQFIYRQGGSGGGDRMLVDYDVGKGVWGGTHQIDSGKGSFKDTMGTSDHRCSYPNGYAYGPDGKLHVTWVWRESSQGANHDLIYTYSEDRGKTWLNNRGEHLPTPPGVDSPGITAVDIPRDLGLMNTHGQAVDSRGHIHTVMWHCTPESLKAAGSWPGEQRWGPPAARRYHHYWRDTEGKWEHVELPWVAGNRPKLLFDHNDNLYLIFQGATEPKQTGRLVIAAATAASKWTDWKVIHTEKGPFFNEMLFDPTRWKSDGILSVMVQERPNQPNASSALRILDFTVAEQ